MAIQFNNLTMYDSNFTYVFDGTAWASMIFTPNYNQDKHSTEDYIDRRNIT